MEKINRFYLSVFVLMLFCLAELTRSELIERRRCKEYQKDVTKQTQIDSNTLDDDDEDEFTYNEDISEINLLNETGVMLCPRETEFCFSVVGVNATGTYLEKQGCWFPSSEKDRDACNNSQCISSPDSHPRAIHKFCCCNTDLCNENFTIASGDPGTAESVIQSSENQPPYIETISLWEVPAFYAFFVVTGIVIFFGMTYIWCRQVPKPMPELSPLAPSGPGYSSNLYNVDNLNVVAMIGQGRFGSVWKGIVNEQPIAVKIFTAHNKQYFYNERDIYSLPFMDNPGLLTYFGSDERQTMDGSIEYLLVLSLAPLGSVQAYLLHNTISFSTFCKMAKSIARGLAHLHAEIKRDGVVKPCVCHRDLNTSNILVKADLSCCICDFGFALKTYGSKYEFRGELVSAETKSINEVGTVRYMAPEILEGAMNLRDCESSLKQIDVYSLGLILWELCVRCRDWYSNEQSVPPYKAPYEAEIGKHPSFEDMQVLVSKQKARPQFPSNWGGGLASKLAKETCEDCWDQDAEARLTSRCVEERINELSSMRPRGNRGLSPTMINNLAAPTTPSFITTSPNAKENVSVLAPIPSASEGSLHGYSSMMKNKELHALPIQPYPYIERSLSSSNSNSSTQVTHIEKRKKDILVHEIISSNNNSSSSSSSTSSKDKKSRGWPGVRAIIERKIFKSNSCEDKSNLVDDSSLTVRVNMDGTSSPAKNVIVNLKSENGLTSSAIHTDSQSHIIRPKNLDLSPISVRTPELYRSLPSTSDNNSKHQKFTIVQQTTPQSHLSPKIVISRSANSMKSLKATSSTSLDLGLENAQLKRQRSLEIYHEVFGPSKDQLRDPSQRVKTPGDVPKSVREKRVRASKTLSLYDDRMMNSGAYL
uniref:receptor protein serine/threonine kinase n=1 Tax=Culicoides sonorensis TaxID=179676 RepID=A0A336M2V6_CULSO